MRGRSLFSCLPIVAVALAACQPPECIGMKCLEPQLSCVHTPGLCGGGEICDPEFGTCHRPPTSAGEDDLAVRRRVRIEEGRFELAVDVVGGAEMLSHLVFQFPPNVALTPVRAENADGLPLPLVEGDNDGAWLASEPCAIAAGGQCGVRLVVEGEIRAASAESAGLVLASSPSGAQHHVSARGTQWSPWPVSSSRPLHQWLDVTTDFGTPVAGGVVRLGEETSSSRRRVFHQTDAFGPQFAAADYESRDLSGAGGPPLTLWVHPEDDGAYVDDATAFAAADLATLEGMLVPFPTPEHAIVVAPTTDGRAWASHGLSMLSPSVRLASDARRTVAHEVSHQWFGVDSDMPSWLSEGFAQLLSARVTTDSGEDLEWLLRNAAGVCPGCDVLLPGAAQATGDEQQQAVVYRKAPLLLHLVALTVGEDAFYAALPAVLDAYRPNSRVASHIFFRVLEDETGTSLQRMLDEWVNAPGWPLLTVSWQIDVDGVSTFVIQQVQTGPTVTLEGAIAPRAFLRVRAEDGSTVPCEVSLPMPPGAREATVTDVCEGRQPVQCCEYHGVIPVNGE